MALAIEDGTLKGEWQQLPNLSAESVGSIHDDEAARKAGFESALVGGSVLLAFMTPELVRLFGQDWYERGFLKQSFIKPIYVSSDVRLAGRELEPGAADERLMSLGFENRDGEPCTAGYVGLARKGESCAPWERDGEAQIDDSSSGEVGTSRTIDVVCTPDLAANRIRREAVGGDDSWYSSASPWGGAIAPTFMYILPTMMRAPGSASGQGGSRSGPANPGMNGTFQLRQYGPMFCGEPHRLTMTVVEKGETGRTAFRTSENVLRTTDDRIVMRARQKVRWFV